MFTVIINGRGRPKTYQVDFAYGEDVTTAIITPHNSLNKPDPARAVFGVTYKAKEDEYCKLDGQKFALKRAIESAGLTRTARELIWNQFKNRYVVNAERRKRATGGIDLNGRL